MIQLSLRYKSNDHLWFTFFHEAGHIIKHGRKEIFLEGNGMDGEKENGANAFARDKLIPLKKYKQFIHSSRLSLENIKNNVICYYNNAVFIATNIKYDVIILQYTGISYVCFKFVRQTPLYICAVVVPFRHLPFRITIFWVAFPKYPKH